MYGLQLVTIMNNVVFIVNIETNDPQRSAPYKYCIDSWSKWCDHNNVKLVVLDRLVYPKHIMNANWHKLMVFDLLEASEVQYDKVLIADADTIIHPNAPNVFDLVDDRLAVVRNYGSMDWVCRSYENYHSELFPDISFSPLDYFNSGILIVNKSHVQLYKTILQFYLDNRIKIQHIQNKYAVGTDQPVLNFMVRKYDTQVNYLGYEWNMQDMTRFELLQPNLPFIECGWVYHFNAIPGGNQARASWIEQTSKALSQL